MEAQSPTGEMVKQKVSGGEGAQGKGAAGEQRCSAAMNLKTIITLAFYRCVPCPSDVET